MRLFHLQQYRTSPISPSRWPALIHLRAKMVSFKTWFWFLSVTQIVSKFTVNHVFFYRRLSRSGTIVPIPLDWALVSLGISLASQKWLSNGKKLAHKDFHPSSMKGWIDWILDAKQYCLPFSDGKQVSSEWGEINSLIMANNEAHCGQFLHLLAV